ncbi:MAG: hypothetical protein ABIQ15_01340 [Nocardioides sp.]
MNHSTRDHVKLVKRMRSTLRAAPDIALSDEDIPVTLLDEDVGLAASVDNSPLAPPLSEEQLGVAAEHGRRAV